MGFEISPTFWMIAFIVLLVMELSTMGLTTIWFAGGTLAGLIVNYCGGGFWPQMIAFVVVSFLLLVFTRPFAMKVINRKHVPTNVQELIGREAVVLEQIDNLHGTGRAQVRGMEWTARAQREEQIISEGTKVEICAIEGVKLIVKEKEDER